MLCKYSQSELLASEILPVCPLGLTYTQSKQCSCKKRQYMPYGGIDLRVVSCVYPKRWDGRDIENLEIEKALLMGAKKTKVGDDVSGIWGGLDIKVLGVCGEYGTGKTLFLQGIDPERTKYYDCEMSSGTYSLMKPENKVDVPKLMGAKKPGYTPLDVFAWWRSDVLAIKSGQYSVIAVDTIADIEQGLSDYVASRHREFGFHTREAFEKTGGIFWSCVKTEWQSLLVEICQRCDTFAFAAHMRDEWIGGSPSGKREPQGKETLMKLASLYLHLGRPKNAKGEQAERPDGIVLKSRLAVCKRDENGNLVKDVNGDFVMVTAMPPRLSPATPGMIRAYIKTPPNYDKLKKSEVAPEVALSDDERLRMQAQIAASQARAAEAETKRLEQIAELKTQPAQATEVATPTVEQVAIVSQPQPELKASEPVPFEPASAIAPAQAATTTSERMPGKAYTRGELIANINALRSDLGIPDEPWRKNLAKRGSDTLEAMSDAGLEDVKSALWTKHTAWKLEQEKKR